MSPSSIASQSLSRVARRLTLSGRVQGLGIRPMIARLAVELRLAGAVSNRLAGVEIEIEGPLEQVELFQKQLADRLPTVARLDAMESEPISTADRTTFVIEESPLTGVIRTEIPADLAVCPECLADVAAAVNRRHGYPFTSCATCGPRYSIINAMPFDRARTRMSPFTLCQECQKEYSDPADRRFHAQTIGCPECGPQVWCGDRNGRLVARHGKAVRIVVDRLLSGAIIALRGIGGYQLLCDATDNQAVCRLRQRKRRPKKPLAVMVADLSSAAGVAHLDRAERDALVAAVNPIVLLRAKGGNRLADSIHPELDSVGVMLPTTPLHWLILRDCGRPLVATSGNREGEPLSIEVAESIERLRDIADLWLHHDRAIAQPVDDSVLRVIADRPVTIRLGRGFAPLRLDLPAHVPAVAVGGQQKSAIAVSNGAQAILAAHLGDLESVRNEERFIGETKRALSLYGVTQPLWIHDLHPDYFTTRWAQDQSGRRVAVQHHHAHIVASMVEHDWLDREVLGVAFDGTGYGTNGTVWGGEFLLATASGFSRVGHLREFPLAGGEAAIREPWRVAVALVHQAKGAKALSRVFSGSLHEKATRLLPMLERPQLSPRTTSVGRLFDGIAALALGIERADFEGFPAMQLEAAADPSVDTAYCFAVEEREPWQLDWRPMIGELLTDLKKGVPAGTIAMRFHRGLAAATASVCRRFAPRPIALGGGVFQNRLLTELFLELMSGSKQAVGLPGRIPPGDGGLAAGQLAIGLALSRPKGADR